MIPSWLERFLQDEAGKLRASALYGLMILNILLGAVVGILAPVLPVIAENYREVNIANQQTHIAETLTVADITQAANHNLATNVAVTEGSIQLALTERIALIATITHIPSPQAEQRLASQTPFVITTTPLAIVEVITHTPWVITATPTPTVTRMPIPEVSANRPWSDNPDIKVLNIPNTEIGIHVALVPRPSSQHFVMAHNESGTIEMPYWIDVNEVTRSLLRECQIEFGCADNANDALEYNPTLGDSYPVTQIDLIDARELCRWRGGRIPLEVEWEYAARGPEGWEYPNNVMNDTSAVWSGNPRTEGAGPMEIAQWRDISWVGANDMLGNVREWTETIASAARGEFIVKGSAFDIADFRFSRRSPMELNSNQWRDIGFRCVFDYHPENPDGLP